MRGGGSQAAEVKKKLSQRDGIDQSGFSWIFVALWTTLWEWKPHAPLQVFDCSCVLRPLAMVLLVVIARVTCSKRSYAESKSKQWVIAWKSQD